MKYKILLFFCFWLLVFAVSCNRDDISFETPSQALRFSADTISCDTVYHQVRSETYAVKVYNDEDKDIMIPKISLAGGASSLYRINVDGKSGYNFSQVPLRKKDSLYIFVEIAPSISGSRAIAEDQILFDSPVGQQHVTLFSVVQDAEFFIKTPTNPNIISGNITWTKNKSKMIYGDLTLASGSTLTIEKGTFVYFFKNSGMKVSSNATVNVNGILGEEVTFRGDRNDPKYDTIPKNWNSMVFQPNSSLNMTYARVFGGIKGLEMYQTNANIQNTIVHTFEEYGIYAVNSTVIASNLVVNNCGKADFGIFKGGNYYLKHCTLANYWDFGSMAAAVSLYAASDWINQNGQAETAPLNLSVQNSILYNAKQNALELSPNTGVTFNYQLQNCLLKYTNTSGTFNFSGNPSIISCYQNEDPKFLDHYTKTMNLRVAADSPAKNKGNIATASIVPKDIVGITRTINPTLGAYQ